MEVEAGDICILMLTHAHARAHTHTHTGGTERDLLDQIVQLEKEVRHRDTVISEFRERGAATSGNEARYLREEIEDLKVCVCMCVCVCVCVRACVCVFVCTST